MSSRRFRCGCFRTRSNTYVIRTTGINTCRRCRLVASRRYGRTSAGKASKVRYRRSAKGRAALRRQVANQRTPEGRAACYRRLGVVNDQGRPVTADDLTAALKRTRGRCALCGKPGRPDDPLVIDHSHQTKRLRGWLHRSENTAEGFMRRAGVLRDVTWWARRLRAYLLRAERRTIKGTIRRRAR